MGLFMALAAEGSSGSIIESLQFWKSSGFSALINNVVSGVVVLILGLIVLKVLLGVLRRGMKRSTKISELLQDYLMKIISIVGWVIVIITVMSQFGIDMAPMIAGLGITGVVLGLALKESISNFFAGFMIILNDLFQKGHYVQFGSIAGTVLSMDLMSVRLKTPDGKAITVNNNYVWGSPITNFSDTDKRRIGIDVGVPYDCDLKVAKQVLLDLITSYPEVLEDPAVNVQVAELGASSINFTVRPWVLPGDYWTVLWRFQSEVVGKLAEKGIEVPFDQLDVNFSNK